MKRDKTVYWTSTGLLSAGMLLSAAMYLSGNPEMMENFHTLGIPRYFVMLLGVAKLLGSVALLIPKWPQLKEWAYAGFTFVFIGAACTHLATGTPWVAPVIALGILWVSYHFRNRLESVHQAAR